jgi:hypothetical protein
MRYERHRSAPGPCYAWWMANGNPTAVTIAGWRAVGINRPTRELTGIIPTMITISKAGSCMKAIGIMMITATRLE